jgi:2-oxoglutarate dehydrogenase E1 component
MRPSFATHLNLDLLEENYRRWQENPEDVDSSWSAFFEGFELGDMPLRNGAAALAPTPERAAAPESPLQTRIDGLVYAYRTLGHTIAHLNPLADKRPRTRSSACASSALATRISISASPRSSSSITSR